MKGNFNIWARRIVACMICGIMTVGLFAVPAYQGWQTKTLADGSQITVRQVGDEFFHYWETEDGVLYKHDAVNGWQKIETATMSEVQKAKQASRKYNRQDDASKPRYAAGKLNLAPRGLVILVNFSDVSFYSGNTRQDMDNLMNSANYNYDGATGSTREYYRAQSNGQYVPDFDVVGPYTLSYNRAHYGGNDDNGDDLLAGDMVVEACKAADADGVDFTQYNNDGDSYIDFVYIIYAGAGEADSGVEDAIWPHNWDLASARYYNNCSYSLAQSKVDGLYINNYACSGELNYGEEGSRCGIGTVAHEFGHVLGLPDYYVTSKDASNYNKKCTPGAWTIMDYGSYNNDGKTPPNYSVFDKYYFGWDTPELLAKDAQRDVTLTTAYSDSYQITGSTSLLAARTTQRVWYIENRQKTGWDAYLPGHGMIVWEVTYNSSNWTNNKPNNETVGYTIVTAGNTTRPYTPYAFNTTSTSTSSTPFPGTSNVRSYTPATGCEMTEITESDGVITFKYNGGDVDYWTYDIDGENCTVPPAGTVDKGAALNLTITPDAGYTLADAECWAVEMGDELLEYGTGFTYNENTGAFAITSVTGNVYIYAKANEKAIPVTLTWMANGSEFATTQSIGSVVLPTTNPANCENGKVFVGWCATENYESESTAPTFVKNGDAVTEATTFYAVFATKGGGSGEPQANKYTFTTNSWTDATSSWSSNKSGYGYTGGQGVQVTTGTNGAGATTKSAVENVSKVTVNYCTNAKKGTGSIDITVGDTKVSHDVNKTGGTSLRDLEFAFENVSGTVSIKVNCSENSIYINAITITSGGGSGTTYSDYTTTCSTPTPVYYTIRFFDNGEQIGEDQFVIKGQRPEVPLNPTPACSAYSFVGWWTTTLAEDNTETKTWITDFTANNDQNYYAIFSRTEAGESGGSTLTEDQLTRATTGVAKNSTSYSNWSGKSVNSDAIYAGNSSGGNDAIQLRSKGSDSGIISTASGGKIKKITVAWNSGTAAERKIDIYGKNTAYSAASDLYNSTTQGTQIGYIMMGSSELVIEGDYTYVGVRSNSGALYLDKITFTWETAAGGSSSTTYYTSFENCSATDIESVETAQPAAIKALRNGQIVIIRGEEVYSITGYRL